MLFKKIENSRTKKYFHRGENGAPTVTYRHNPFRKYQNGKQTTSLQVCLYKTDKVKVLLKIIQRILDF